MASFKEIGMIFSVTKPDNIFELKDTISSQGSKGKLYSEYVRFFSREQLIKISINKTITDPKAPFATSCFS